MRVTRINHAAINIHGKWPEVEEFRAIDDRTFEMTLLWHVDGPMPTDEKYWSYTQSISMIEELVEGRMFPLTVEGLSSGMDRLMGG